LWSLDGSFGYLLWESAASGPVAVHLFWRLNEAGVFRMLPTACSSLRLDDPDIYLRDGRMGVVLFR
jgi:hypothetical protein